MSVRLLPRSVVDRLPAEWWRPGNLHVALGLNLHFCVEGDVRSIELNGRVIALGRAPFPFGHEG